MTRDNASRVPPQRSKLVGAYRVARMKMGHLLRGTPHPAPVGRPDYYTRELDSSLFLRSASGLPERDFVPAGFAEEDPRSVARQCFSEHGVYPLGFSFPTTRVQPVYVTDRPHFLSTTYPGTPHSFTTWEDYLHEYRSSFFALSTKKGGWDTFRHLEILFSGAIPLMPGLARSSRYALAHYPKRALSDLLESLVTEGPATPDQHTRDFFFRWAEEHLTTRAMASYVVEISEMSTERVIFLDRALASRTDYLSAFSFIGLTEVLGSSLVAAFEPSFLFDDFSGDTTRHYGKGFGYTKVIPSALRSTDSLSLDSSRSELLELVSSASTIVVGNYDANRDEVGGLLDAGIDPSRLVCILGSDFPPDRSMLRDIKRSGMTFFVREFAS